MARAAQKLLGPLLRLSFQWKKGSEIHGEGGWSHEVGDVKVELGWRQMVSEGKRAYRASYRRGYKWEDERGDRRYCSYLHIYLLSKVSLFFSLLST